MSEAKRLPFLLQEDDKGFIHEIAFHFLQGSLKSYWLKNKTPSFIQRNINELSKDKHENYIPVGSVGFVEKYMELFDIKYTPIDYSHPIFSNTKIVKGNLKDIKSINQFPVFVKPQKIKKFSGLVVDDIGEYNELLEFYNVTEDEPIFFNFDVKDYKSEWRIYIHRGKIINISNYEGNPVLSTDFQAGIFKEIAQCKAKMPVAYTIDVGYDRVSEKWYPIEMNDFWGTGAYGCPNEWYYLATVDRWMEIVSSSVIKSGIEWYDTIVSRMDWESAMDIQKLYEADGWRLPTVDELKTAYEKADNGFQREGFYLSSDTAINDSHVWALSFANGELKIEGKTNSECRVKFCRIIGEK